MATAEELIAELQAYVLEHDGDAPAEAAIAHVQPAPESKPRSLRDELEELSAGPFDLARERRKSEVAALIAAGQE